MVRSERRSYHSPRFKNTYTHHELCKPPLMYDDQAADTTVRILKAKSTGASMCDWIKVEVVWMWRAQSERREHLLLLLFRYYTCNINDLPQPWLVSTSHLRKNVFLSKYQKFLNIIIYLKWQEASCSSSDLVESKYCRAMCTLLIRQISRKKSLTYQEFTLNTNTKTKKFYLLREMQYTLEAKIFKTYTV